jgi:hypothetical protein
MARARAVTIFNVLVEDLMITSFSTTFAIHRSSPAHLILETNISAVSAFNEDFRLSPIPP